MKGLLFLSGGLILLAAQTIYAGDCSLRVANDVAQTKITYNNTTINPGQTATIKFSCNQIPVFRGTNPDLVVPFVEYNIKNINLISGNSTLIFPQDFVKSSPENCDCTLDGSKGTLRDGICQPC